MPTYDYECSACGHTFEELQSFSDAALTKCPKCKKKKLNRLFGGGGAILFKGSGFYETDYRRAGEKTNGDGKAGSKDSDKSETTSETKVEAKPETTSEPKPAAKAETKESGGRKAK